MMKDCSFLLTLAVAFVVLASCVHRRSSFSVSDDLKVKPDVLYESGNVIHGYTTIYDSKGNVVTYSKDSTGDYRIYYAKMDFVTGNFQHIKNKIVRIDLNDSTGSVSGIYSFLSSVKMYEQNDGTYSIVVLDNKLQIWDIGPLELEQNVCHGENTMLNDEDVRMLHGLAVATRVARDLSGCGIESWKLTETNLAKSCNMRITKPLKQDSVYDEKYYKIIRTMEYGIKGLDSFYNHYHSYFD